MDAVKQERGIGWDNFQAPPSEICLHCCCQGDVYQRFALTPDGETQTFTFNSSPESIGQGGSWTIPNSGSKQYISFYATDTTDPETYVTLTETLPDTTWTLTSASCELQNGTATGTWNPQDTEISNIIIEQGLETTCTFTNTQSASLTIVKRIINDNGGSAVVGDFDIDTNATTATEESFNSAVADGANTLKYSTNKITGLSAGTYSLTEIDLGGYNEGEWSCTGTGGSNVVSTYSAGSVDLANGADVTCTITNNDNKNDPTGSTTMKWVLKDAASYGIRAGAPNASSATIEFKLYSDASCTSQVGSSIKPTVTLENAGTTASADTGSGIPVSATGTYYWTTEYSGDDYNNSATTGCGSEVTTIGETNNTID